MPRRVLLSASDRATLLAIPDNEDDLFHRYEFSEDDIHIVKQRRGEPNRLGFAVQLCYMRYPGYALGAEESPSPALLTWVSGQIGVSPQKWILYGRREQTRREHLAELQLRYGFTAYTQQHRSMAMRGIANIAAQTDRGIVVAQALVTWLRQRAILLPSITVLEHICAEAVTRATRRVYGALTGALLPEHKQRLDALLERKPGTPMTVLAWLRQDAGKPNSKHMLRHLERLNALRELALPDGIEHLVHRNRILKMAREAAQMMPKDIARLETSRRHATLVALAIESTATVKDQVIDLHDRILGKVHNAAKNKHKQDFHQSARSINDKVRLYGQIGQALLDARKSADDPFAAIEEIMSWEAFAESVAEARDLAQPADFDHLHKVADNYATIRRYAPAFLQAVELRAAPAAKDLVEAVNLLRKLNAEGKRKVPDDAPLGFIRRRWKPLVCTSEGIDRRYYELCALSEIKNSLRAGDVSVSGSRQFKDFDEYLLSTNRFASMTRAGEVPVAIHTDCQIYLEERLSLLQRQLEETDAMAAAGTLRDAAIDDTGLKIAALDNSVPASSEELANTVGEMLPRVKITELLLEVDSWTGFTRHFTQIRRGEATNDTPLLLTAILADAINLGLHKMAHSCPGSTHAKLSWLKAWHIRDETYAAALAELVNVQSSQSIAAHWGDGSTSSSDGQYFRTGGAGEKSGQVNPKYGHKPGKKIYTHISDQYAPFNTRLINVGAAASTHVLDGLLYHESDLRIEEHYTDTGGFTDHVFALTHLLGFRFAPRIRNFGDTRLHIPPGKSYPALQPLVGDKLNIKHIQSHWDEILRLAASIRTGTVSASLIMRKLSGYTRKNGLARALQELGRLERTLFMLNWLRDPGLRRRVHVGLNKGEARNAMARAIFFRRLGELRDRTFEQQRYRASGLNLVTAAITLWNTVYIERAIFALESQGHGVDHDLLGHLSPVAWDHIALTGDYVWRQASSVEKGRFRSLKAVSGP